MHPSPIPAQELVKRLCNDRKHVSRMRVVVDQLPIIRDLGNKNLHGWELDLDDAEDAA